MSIQITFLNDAVVFLDTLEVKSKKKILFDINKTKIGLRGEWFRKMPGTNDLWEFRTFFNKTYYRIFAFWDTRNKQQTLVVCTHGLIKKTDRTPDNDLAKAERLKTEYFKH